MDREAADPDVLSQSEQDLLLRGAPWTRFVVIGDSIAKGLGEQAPGYAPDNWGQRVTNALRRLRPAFEYRNLGEHELRAAEVREKQLDPALAFGPDLASVVCGGNDLLARRFDGDAVERELDAMVAGLRGAGADVVTFTTLDITRALDMPAEFGADLRDRLHELSERVRAVSRRRGALLVDLESQPVSADAGIYSKDFRHANTRGHAIVASFTIRRLAERLGNELPEEARTAEPSGDPI